MLRQAATVKAYRKNRRIAEKEKDDSEENEESHRVVGCSYPTLSYSSFITSIQ